MKNKAINRLSQIVSHKDIGLWVVALSWFIINSGLYLLYGIQTGLESEKYINQATQLYETGGVSEFRYHFYFGIIGLLYFVKLLGLNIYSAIYIQLAVSLAAHLYLYNSLKLNPAISISSRTSALLLIIIAPSFEYWNWTLYSESIFFSAILFFAATCIKNKPTDKRSIAIQVLLLTFCILSRPSGVLLIIPWILYVLQTNFKHRSWKMISACLLAGGVAFIAISNVILGTIGGWHVMDPFTNGYVICDISEYSQAHQFSLTANSPIGQLIEFTLKYPAEFLSLTFKKLVAFFTQYRDYYSPLHNAYVIIYSLVTLGLFLKGLIFGKLKDPLTLMLYSAIALWTISIIFQSDDYHSRFYNAILPLVILVGINPVARSFKKNCAKLKGEV